MERDLAHLLDILEASKLALSYVEGISEEAFQKNTQLQDSVIRRIEIIGEAARRISTATQKENPKIPWREMIGMRNLLIHEYDDVDLLVVWQTLQNDLPRLIEAIQPLLPVERSNYKSTD